MAVIVGTKNVDNLVGTISGDYIFGLGAGDDLRGGGGDDEIKGGGGNDFVLGAGGDDDLFGGAGRDRLIGGAGEDSIVAANFDADFSGADKINAGSGDDQVTIGLGDVALGGTGFDTFTFIADFAGKVTYTIDLSKIHLATETEFGLGADTKVGQFENAIINLSNAAGGSSVRGSNGSDVISGPSFVSGDKGLVFDGGSGDDTLNGTDGKDTLRGGAGSDFLNGVGGGDVLAGGKGDDLFILTTYDLTRTGFEADVIKDFKPGQDHFLLQGVTSGFGSVNFDVDNLLRAGADPTANAATAQFLYDTDAGKLFLDLDGTGAGESFLVATFAGKTPPPITATDFVPDLF